MTVVGCCDVSGGDRMSRSCAAAESCSEWVGVIW